MQSLTVCFLLLLIFTVHAHVVQRFEGTCDQYFYKRSVPQLDASNNYVRICQTFANQYRFATLYDTFHRIPVYSAYIYERNNETGREKRWFIEPQLVDQNWDKHMMTADDLKDGNKTSMGDKQATNWDYLGLHKNRGFNRGHLNPNLHHSGLGRNATFTLTNIVPQNAKLNGGSWNKYETKLHNDTFKDCKTAYVLVGAVPSENNWVIKNNQKRVNIPDYMWQAYCCVDNNDRPYKSGGAAVRNENTEVVECSLDSLKDFFAKVNLRVGDLFDNCSAPNNNGDKDCASVVDFTASALASPLTPLIPLILALALACIISINCDL